MPTVNLLKRLEMFLFALILHSTIRFVIFSSMHTCLFEHTISWSLNTFAITKNKAYYILSCQPGHSLIWNGYCLLFVANIHTIMMGHNILSLPFCEYHKGLKFSFPGDWSIPDRTIWFCFINNWMSLCIFENISTY